MVASDISGRVVLTRDSVEKYFRFFGLLGIPSADELAAKQTEC